MSPPLAICPDNQGYFYGNWETDVREPNPINDPGTGKYLGSTGLLLTARQSVPVYVFSRKGNWEITPPLDLSVPKNRSSFLQGVLNDLLKLISLNLNHIWGKAGSLPTRQPLGRHQPGHKVIGGPAKG